MKAINEIWFRLGGLICVILVPLCDNVNDDLWTRLISVGIAIAAAFITSWYLTEMLIAFKKWWKE
jgi:hypothetical protein